MTLLIEPTMLILEQSSFLVVQIHLNVRSAISIPIALSSTLSEYSEIHQNRNRGFLDTVKSGTNEDSLVTLAHNLFPQD
jgi:hypothetical protein